MTRQARGRILSTALVMATAMAVILGSWAFWWEPDRLVLRRVTLELPDWPARHGALKVALLSDLHAGAPYIDAEKIKAAVATINAAAPDLILLLGDYVIHGVVGGRRIGPEDFGPLLQDLTAPLGTYAVLGNHDWWDGPGPIRTALENAGVRLLDNRAIKLVRADGALWLLGLGDFMEGGPRIEETLADVGDDLPILAFTHNPDLFPALPRRITLTVAGHTHGGQVALPLVGRPIVPSQYGERFAYGHIVEEGRQLFVTSGLGTSILPVRFRVPPEIVLLTIRAR